MNAILKFSEFRSELAQYDQMVLQKSTYSYGKEEKVEYFQPISEEHREQKIEELENLKRKYDQGVQGANWTIELDLET